MTIFCLLWTPFFYLFWRSLNDKSTLESGTWALLVGTFIAFFRFFLGNFINPGGFGFSRWVYACVDIIALPIALPYFICIILVFLRIIPSQANLTNYAFLWLIPVAAIRALAWTSYNNPILLIGVPVLWTAITLGIGLFLHIAQQGFSWAAIPAVLGALVLPFIGATAYWALFSQQNLLGIGLVVLCLIPMFISLTLSFLETRRG